MRYFTHYWQNETWDFNREVFEPGEFLTHIAGNLFTKRGVRVGDIVYVVTVRSGVLFLCGKLKVGHFATPDEAARLTGLSIEELWAANEHILASEATEARWDLELTVPEARKLEFVSDGIAKGLKFKSRDQLDQQTLRGVRQLMPESAKILDGYLDTLEIVRNFASVGETEESVWSVSKQTDEIDSEFQSFPEGTKKQKFVTYYERIPENREAAIRIHGCTCFGCEFNFEKTYGSHGAGFIHIHHTKPISEFETPRTVDPATELIPLCPNCHAMVHRNRAKTLDLDELRAIIHGQSSN